MKCYRDLFKKEKIKTTNNKMSKNTNISTIEYKKQTKQTRKTEQNHEYGECFDGCQMGGACGGMGEEVKGLKSTNR